MKAVISFQQSSNLPNARRCCSKSFHIIPHVNRLSYVRTWSSSQTTMTCHGSVNSNVSHIAGDVSSNISRGKET